MKPLPTTYMAWAKCQTEAAALWPRPAIWQALRQMLRGAAFDRKTSASTMETATLKALLTLEIPNRFASPEQAAHYMADHVAGFQQNPQAQQNLDNLIRQCQNFDPDTVAHYVLSLLPPDDQVPRDEAILSWVSRNILHPDSHPLETTVGAAAGKTRALTPVEVVVLGLGKCNHLAEVACFLLEAAGYQTRRFGVALHTYLEYQRTNGCWQLADPDITDWGTFLSRGLSLQALLENPTDWAPLLDQVACTNRMPYSLMLLPGVFRNSNAATLPTSNANAPAYELTAWFDDRPFIDGWKTHVVWPMATGVDKWLLPNQFTVRPLGDNQLVLRCDEAIAEPLSIVFCTSSQPFTKAPAWLDDNQTNLFVYRQSAEICKAIFNHAEAVTYGVLYPGQATLTLPFLQKTRPYYAILVRRLTSPLATPIVATLEDEPRWIDSVAVAAALAQIDVGGRLVYTDAPLPVAFERFREALVYVSAHHESLSLDAAAVRFAHEMKNGLGGVWNSLSTLELPHVTRCLDAGCGTGEWTLGLAQWAQLIDAIDYTPGRVDFLNALLTQLGEHAPAIRAVQGSVETLPYGADVFDLVFCRGVIFMVDAPKTLQEFYRCLKPGGEVYIHLNADGWNLSLAHDPERSESVRRQGRDTLYNTVWRRHQKSLQPISATAPSTLNSVVSAQLMAWKLLARKPLKTHVRPENLKTALERLDLDQAESLYQRCLANLPLASRHQVRAFELAARHLCGDAHLTVIWRDLIGLLSGCQTKLTTSVSSQSWAPEEFAALVQSIGFVDFRWASENCRPLLPEQPTVQDALPLTAKGQSHYNGYLSVWECRFKKPE
jgi:SAM-dependent methyltransferase